MADNVDDFAHLLRCGVSLDPWACFFRFVAKGSSYYHTSLFQMPAQHVILVDACNVLHALPAFRPRSPDEVERRAAQLLERLRPLHDSEGWELHLVVDGRGPALNQHFPTDDRTLSLIFSPSNRSADSIIEAWLLRIPRGWRVCVASADRAVRHSALSVGAEILSPEDLLGWADRVAQRMSRRIAIPKKPFGNSFDELMGGS